MSALIGKINDVKLTLPDSDVETTIGDVMKEYVTAPNKDDLNLMVKFFPTSDIQPVEYGAFIMFLDKYNVLNKLYPLGFSCYYYTGIELDDEFYDRLVHIYNDLKPLLSDKKYCKSKLADIKNDVTIGSCTSYYRRACLRGKMLQLHTNMLLPFLMSMYTTPRIAYAYIMRSVLLSWSENENKTNALSEKWSLNVDDINNYICDDIYAPLLILSKRWLINKCRSKVEAEYECLIDICRGHVYTTGMLRSLLRVKNTYRTFITFPSIKLPSTAKIAGYFKIPVHVKPEEEGDEKYAKTVAAKFRAVDVPTPEHLKDSTINVVLCSTKGCGSLIVYSYGEIPDDYTQEVISTAPYTQSRWERLNKFTPTKFNDEDIAMLTPNAGIADIKAIYDALLE
jgi:hypothetical protein